MFFPLKIKINLALNFILDLLFPIECLSCGLEGHWLCPKCFRKLSLEKDQACPGCKKEDQAGTVCRECRQSFYFDKVLIAADYGSEPAKSLIKTCKYKFVRDIAPILGDYLFLFIRNFAARQDLSGRKQDIFGLIKNGLVVPIPLHKRRQRWRGFNQSEEIALRLAERCGVCLNADLVRVKYRKPQSKLSKTKRAKMISGCFAWKGEDLGGRPVLIIDDVFTTGATMNEAAKILKANGAGKVWGLAVAGGR
jgi:ComF family protein